MLGLGVVVTDGAGARWIVHRWEARGAGATRLDRFILARIPDGDDASGMGHRWLPIEQAQHVVEEIGEEARPA